MSADDLDQWLRAAALPWQVVPNSGDPGGGSPSLANRAELPDVTVFISRVTSRDLFICAKDLLLEANPAMWRVIAPAFQMCGISRFFNVQSVTAT